MGKSRGRKPGSKQKKPIYTGKPETAKPVEVPAAPAEFGLAAPNPDRFNQGGYDEVEDEEHTLAIVRFRMQGATFRTIYALMKQTYGIASERCDRLFGRAQQKLVGEFIRAPEIRKAEAIGRVAYLQERLHNYREYKTKKGEPRLRLGVVSQLLRAEEIRAELEGNKAPIEVKQNVTIQAALMQMTAELTPEQRDLILSQAREQKRLAELARTSLPAHVVEGIPEVH